MGVSHGGVYAANSTDMNFPGLDELDLMSVGCFLNTNTMVLVDISLPHPTLLSFSLASLSLAFRTAIPDPLLRCPLLHSKVFFSHSLFGIPSCRYNFSGRSTVR